MERRNAINNISFIGVDEIEIHAKGINQIFIFKNIKIFKGN